MKPSHLLIFMALFSLNMCTQASDRIELTNQATIEGEVLNPSEMPRKTWQVQMAEGIVVELPNRKSVDRPVMRPKAEAQYYAKVPFLPESAESHLKLAEICMAQGLSQLGKLHYERVLDFDPENQAARQALNYRKIDGEWTTLEEEMLKKGYVKNSRGAWVTSQKLLIDEQRVQIGQQHQESSQAALSLIARYKANPTPETENALYALADPKAVPTLAEALKNEPNPEFRSVFVWALARLGTGPAYYEIAQCALRETDEYVRQNCIQVLQNLPGIANLFVPLLASSDNAVVNRAASIIGQLNDRTAIPALINALVTQHEVDVRRANPSVGGQAPRIQKATEYVSNREVLVALQNLTRMDFGFDIPAWWNWWAEQNSDDNFDARRGSRD